MNTTTPRPPHDPELGAALEMMLSQLGDATMNLETARAMRTERALPTPGLSVEALAEANIIRRDITVPVAESIEVEASVFSRSDHTGSGPGIYHVHGRGMIAGHRLVGVDTLLSWIVDHDAVLLTIDYRLAPEHPDPTPVEDSYAGLVWMHENADSLGVDPATIIIAGASAGGGIAAGTALLARDRKGPPLAAQALLCPMLDDRDSTVASTQFVDNTLWSRDSNRFGWSCLLGDRVGTDDVSMYAAPGRATDLSGLPPTFIDCGSAEVFRDEDAAYASRLWEAGVDAELHVWAGGYHGFDMVAQHAAVSQAAIAARNNWAARHIGNQ